MKCPHCGKETEENKDIRDALRDFETFRLAYPRRRGGQRWPAASVAYARLLRDNKIDSVGLIGAAELYRRYCGTQRIEGTEFVMQAATWLGQGGGWMEDWSTETRFDTARRQLQETE